MNYHKFLKSKYVECPDCGREPGDIHPMLFDFQRDIVKFAVRKGRAAIFADCGLGKTFMQLEWGRLIGGTILILAPLAVSRQTVREGEKIGVKVNLIESADDVIDNEINITNYEKLHKLDPSVFNGIILDESSILKSFTGKIRNSIISEFRMTPYKLACTATPSPNDHMELGNHAEFLGTMTRAEMFAMFFVHDGARTSQWRLKRHAQKEFWRWICSWAVYVRNPEEIGYKKMAEMPPLRIHKHIIESTKPSDGYLFPMEVQTLSERREARKSSVDDRVSKAIEIVKKDKWLVWCNLNIEGDKAERALDNSTQISGSDTDSFKEGAMIGFANGEINRLITKPKIAGHGMNWQGCHSMIFLGLSDSFESYYQAIRRCWRFGQTKPVDVHIIISSAEQSVLRNIERKQKEYNTMADEMSINTKDLLNGILHNVERNRAEYITDIAHGDNWTLYLGDCVEVSKEVPDESIGLSVFSPPFASLYTYSNSERDMGNCSGTDEFIQHFGFFVDELLRITMPGRMCCCHCMNLPTSKTRDGYIGIRDFRGYIIKLFEDKGWIYHSEVTIWKDPVIAMQRTKALGLLHKQIKKDSCMSRMGIPDYVVTFRKPGDNPIRVTHTNENFPVSLWQRWASPIWDDIKPSDTLQRTSAREEKDERHIAPLQLEVIRRCLSLWSKAGDIVFSPFAGIGSEGYEAIKNGRRFIGIELKKSYYDQAFKNLEAAEKNQHNLFSVSN